MTVFRGGRSALDVLDAIEDEDADVDEIFIALPAVSMESDKDSSEEDGRGTTDNLSGRRLCAPAVALLADGRVVGDDDGDTEEEEEPQHASTSKLPVRWAGNGPTARSGSRSSGMPGLSAPRHCHRKERNSEAGLLPC